MSDRPNPVAMPDGRYVTVLEERVTSGPLGLRFRDATLDTPIRRGLLVRARAASGDVTSTAIIGSTGIYGFPSLETTKAAERLPVADFASTDPYYVDVVDLQKRFVRTLTMVDAPMPLSHSPTHLLFSAPQRSALPGFGVVRASLRLVDSSVAEASGRSLLRAAHAVVDVTVDDVVHSSVADENGEVAVLVPFGQIDVGAAAHDQEVEAEVEVRFDPTLTPPDGMPIPLAGAIAAQPVRSHIEGPVFRPDHTFTIGFQQEVVLTSPERSDLLLQPI